MAGPGARHKTEVWTVAAEPEMRRIAEERADQDWRYNWREVTEFDRGALESLGLRMLDLAYKTGSRAHLLAGCFLWDVAILAARHLAEGRRVHVGAYLLVEWPDGRRRRVPVWRKRRAAKARAGG